MKSCTVTRQWRRSTGVPSPTKWWFGHKRSGNDCRIHWTNHSSPLLNKEAWSSQESKNLFKIARKHEERDWAKIARELGTGRTAFDCLRHYQTSRSRGKGGRRWSKEEDNKLKSAVNLYGPQNWVKVAHYIGGSRTSINCYHRWTMSLCPDLKRGKWSEAEDEQLIKGVGVHGKKTWSKVCQYVPGRTQSQCRERYLNVLDSDLKKGHFTMEEDRILLEACQPYEESNTCIPWSKIAKSSLPKRTDAMCSIRWKQLKSDDEVFQQFTNQALKRYSHPIKNVTTLPDTTDIPEVVKKKVEKFKYRYTTRDKRKSSAVNLDSYPSPGTIISWDNSEMNDHLTARQKNALPFLPTYNFRQYSAALKNGSSMFSSQPLHDSHNWEGQSSTSRNHSDQDPNNDQTMDGTVQNILSNLRGGTTSANVGAPLNGGEQSGSQSSPEPIIDLTQDDDDDDTSSNVTAGNRTVAMGTTAAMDMEVDMIDMIMSQYDSSHKHPTTLKPLPKSFHMPPADLATRTETGPHNVESHMNTEQYTRNSDTTPLMINDTVSCDLRNGHTPTLITSGSRMGALIDIGTRTYSRDGNGKIVRLLSFGGKKSDSMDTMRGEGNFPVGPRFVLRPLISEQSFETTAASHDSGNTGNEESDMEYNDNELNAVTTVTTTCMSSSIFSVSEDISTNENGGQSILLGDETTACVVLPNDYGMSQRYSVDLHMVDGTSLINSETGSDESRNQTNDLHMMDGVNSEADILSSGESTINQTSVTYSQPLADTNILSSGATDSIVSNIPVISNSAGGRNFTEIERVLAAELLRFTPRTDYRTKADERKLELEKFVFEMAGFDLPVQIASEKDVLMEADARMIVYEPNHVCYGKFQRHYRRRNTGSIITPLSNDDLISRHFALSQVPVHVLPVKDFTHNIINAAIVGDYHYRLQVYATYDILIYDTYCPKQKYRAPAKPQKRPTATSQSTTGGSRKRKNLEKAKSPQPKRAKRAYVRKKGVASKTVEEVAQGSMAAAINAAIVSDYQFRLQVYASYDVLIHNTYCPKKKYKKPQNRPTATGKKAAGKKSASGIGQKRKNVEKVKSPQPKRAKRTYVRKKGATSKTVEKVAQGNKKRAPAKSQQGTRKHTTKRGASKTATECAPIDPPFIEQVSITPEDPSNKTVKKKRSFRKRKCPPDNSNTSEQSAAHPSTSKAMDSTTIPSSDHDAGNIPSDVGTTPSDVGPRGSKRHSNRKQKPLVEDGDETATVVVGVSPSESVKRRRKTVKYY
ncbi:uncharacterized protein LOC135335872 isoform X3 [Halichondria panicea]|uniref:uncharacterized protein LOC135335872 isoform X3 n=1 Tax=Halichondria panicea TaxID=6063 RepID=UPI00312B8318